MKKTHLICMILTIALLGTPWIVGSTSSVGEYDPWDDLDDDGDIDIFDIVHMAANFGTSGEPYVAKAAIEFDSGWIDITNMCSQPVILEHGLNSLDVMVDLTGKMTLDGGVHQRYLGCTGITPGWTMTYGDVDYDVAWDVAQTADGGYILVGDSYSFGGGFCDGWLVKTDANGNYKWSRTYGGSNDDYARSVVQTSDGGYVFVGHTVPYGAVDLDGWLVKTDANGVMQWNMTYGGIGHDYAYSVVQTVDGGFAFAGETSSFGSGAYDFWLVKTDANGNMQWERAHGGVAYDAAEAVVQTADGGYALAGDSYSFGAGLCDGWLVKTYADGTFQWGFTYGGADYDYAYSLCQTVDGGYTVVGTTDSFGAGSGDGWLVKTDESGNMQWSRTYGGISYDRVWDVVQTVDGGYALAGDTASSGAGGSDAWLVKTDVNGNMQWSRAYGGASADHAFAVVQTVDGGFALACDTNSFGAGSDDGWLVKADAELGLMWADSGANGIMLYRGATDPYWNFVRVRIWKLHNTP